MPVVSCLDPWSTRENLAKACLNITTGLLQMGKCPCHISCIHPRRPWAVIFWDVDASCSPQRVICVKGGGWSKQTGRWWWRHRRPVIIIWGCGGETGEIEVGWQRHQWERRWRNWNGMRVRLGSGEVRICWRRKPGRCGGMAGLDKGGLIPIVNLKLAFVFGSGRPQYGLLTDKLAVARTVCDAKETDIELRLPLDVHAVINIFLSPLLDWWENMRQTEKSPEDSKLRTALENMRYKACTAEDIAFLHTRISGLGPDKPKLAQKWFRNVSIITAWNAHKDQINRLGSERFARENGQKLMTFYSKDQWADDDDNRSNRRKINKVTKQHKQRSSVLDPARFSEFLAPAPSCVLECAPQPQPPSPPWPHHPTITPHHLPPPFAMAHPKPSHRAWFSGFCHIYIIFCNLSHNNNNKLSLCFAYGNEFNNNKFWLLTIVTWLTTHPFVRVFAAGILSQLR
jgi:hypothetical protein